MTAVTVGNWTDPGSPAISGTEISLRALELVTHWSRCGLTADWLAGFFAYDFEPAARADATGVLSTAINELVENAAKFCADKTEAMTIAVHHHGDVIRIETRNRVDTAHADKLRRALEELGSADLDALFARRIAHQAEPAASGIGLLILVKDYGARIGARLISSPTGEIEARVQVTLDAEEVSER